MNAVLLGGHYNAGTHDVPKQQPDRYHNSSNNIVEPITVYHGIYYTKYERLLISAVASNEHRQDWVGREVDISIYIYDNRRYDEWMQQNPRDVLKVAESAK